MIIILNDLALPVSGFRCGAATLLLCLSAAHLPAEASQPNVVAVDGTLCDLTRTLAGSAAKVTCLIPPGGDPHGYQLKPSDRQALSKAALVVHIGFNLTPSAKKITAPGPVLAVGELALPNYRGNDPHVWHDPVNSSAIVSVLARQLSDVVSASDRPALAARASQSKAVFDSLNGWASQQFGSLPAAQRVLVTDHQTYSHLASRYGLEEIAMLDSYSTGGVLKPSSLRTITSAVKASGAKTIFPPSLPANKTLKRISRSTGLPISTTPLYGEGVGAGMTAISTSVKNICTMVNGQGGNCDRSAGNSLSSRWSAIR